MLAYARFRRWQMRGESIMKLFRRLPKKSCATPKDFGFLEALLMLTAMYVLMAISCLAFGWEKITRRRWGRQGS
jgi:hypothetical protein